MSEARSLQMWGSKGLNNNDRTEQQQQQSSWSPDSTAGYSLCDLFVFYYDLYVPYAHVQIEK